jgi:PIN domain
MFKMLLDTCVWLDLAKDQRQEPLLVALEEMVRTGRVALIVPAVVLAEFRRNRERVVSERARGFSSHLRAVREAVDSAGGDKRRVRLVLSHLDDVSSKILLGGGAAADASSRIEQLLVRSAPVEPTEAVRLRAAQRALDGRAPFSRGRNAMADAIIIETYAECVREQAASGLRFAFVTHNKNDFGAEGGNHKTPHADFQEIFSRIRSRYFISLAEALRLVDPSLVADLLIERSWKQETRVLGEILEAEEFLYCQVWYGRHGALRQAVEEGRIEIVDRESPPSGPGAQRTVRRDVWKAAERAARIVERRYGKKSLGPWSDFEWGMVSGKLSALRWVLGDEWDMLDS